MGAYGVTMLRLAIYCEVQGPYLNTITCLSSLALDSAGKLTSCPIGGRPVSRRNASIDASRIVMISVGVVNIYS